MSSERRRRRLGRRSALAGLLGLGGCGFRPLYAPALHGGAAEQLARVRVGLIPERHGQLLRRALEDRLGTAGPGRARYDLRVGLDYAIDVQGFARDGTPSRVRMIATANWFLYDLAIPPRLIAHGSVRAADAYNFPENQFFAADLARDTMERRLIEQLAEDIVQRLAVRLVAMN